MSGLLTLAVDAMSGDRPPESRIVAVQRFLQRHQHARVILVGDEAMLGPASESVSRKFKERFEIRHASQIVGMDEHPRNALRGKKDSSMRVAVNLVKQGDAVACVSAGNTGALMATGRFVLKMAPGVDRPAILSTIPAINGHTLMLDLGANADCSAAQLFEFAVMGSVVAREVHGIAAPAVALLNIGEEEIKGTHVIREAAQMLADSSLNYIGFVEGNDIFTGKVDVVVTDGFTGNVSLKTMEGAAHLLGALMREEFRRSFATKLAGLMAGSVLRSLRRRLDPRRYNGASLVGLSRMVIKSHGGADDVAFENALETALLEVKKAVPEQISAALQAERSLKVAAK
ncbi:MAG: phosphate acyltransferase PlsX [Gammaproteobacteria bacterium]|nr:phosphate acyltransferase PlsX [Gammaproteobacteria bacterium]